MKKLLAAAAATTLALCAIAITPVGHRGSGWGMENSAESFTRGALKGYPLLETDFRVTADSQFVCSHDDSTTRLGGKLCIATSTLSELQGESLSQKRLDSVYSGHLCSGQEYLDICRRMGVRPLIELKWSTGINSNDCSNIPMLIDFIERNGFRDSCIILTSMKPCLQYIRENYPDIELQFLTGQYWPNHFDWCDSMRIDVNIQKAYLSEEAVKKFHDAGLKVNLWTTNDSAEISRFTSWGCDFYTTDRL